jgi:hypothetical protein
MRKQKRKEMNKIMDKRSKLKDGTIKSRDRRNK